MKIRLSCRILRFKNQATNKMEQNILFKKLLKAVTPYYHPGFLNFKVAPYEAWRHNGGGVAKSCYPPRFMHGTVLRWELHTIFKNRK